MNALRPLRDSLRAPLPVYVLVGSDPWLARAALDEIRAAVLEPATRAFNDAAFSAGDDGAAGFGDVARTVPMMAARRLVVVKQVEEANAALLDAVLAYLAAPCPSAVLVLLGEKFPGPSGGVDRGIRIQNAAKKAGLVLKLDAGSVDFAEFVGLLAKDRGVTLASDAGRALAELSGDELAILAANLEKCADYVGAGGTVTAAVVEEVCVSTVDTEVWGLTDALVTRDRDRALGTLHRLLEDGEPPHRLLAMVAWQLRQVLAIQDVVKRGLSDREANVRLPPQKVRAIRDSVGRRPLSPSATLEELAAVNRAMNSSRAGDRRVVEAWILRLVAL